MFWKSGSENISRSPPKMVINDTYLTDKSIVVYKIQHITCRQKISTEQECGIQLQFTTQSNTWWKKVTDGKRRRPSDNKRAFTISSR